ncbi:MAG: hypothetical protein AB4206_22160 [Xenococcaceae cyanobacterium]
MTYTTQQLIEILDRELKANWKGKRIVLSSAERINDPVVAKLLNMNQVSKVFAYQDFRHQIHQYQKEHQVSGIIWRNCTFREQTFSYPEIYNQLIPIDEDKEILVQAKESVIAFWQKVTEGMNFWLASAPGRNSNLYSAKLSQDEKTEGQEDRLSHSRNPNHHQKIDREYVNKLIRQAEWAEIDAALNEIYLGLCWGDPLEYRYQWAKPKSGCDRIIAAYTEPSSIKI